jgi:hypothetical protein
MCSANPGDDPDVMGNSSHHKEVDDNDEGEYDAAGDISTAGE